MFVHLGVGELLPAVAKDYDTAITTEHQVEFDVTMTKNIEVVVIAQLLLLFGKEDKFFFVLSFVWARMCEFFQTAFFCPFITNVVTPCCRYKAKKTLQ